MQPTTFCASGNRLGSELKKNEVNVFLRGGLGNQLFQYSAGVHIASISNRNLVIREDLLPGEEDEIDGVSRFTNQLAAFNHSGVVVRNRTQPQGATNSFGKFMQVQRMLGDYYPNFTRRMRLLAAESSSPEMSDVDLIGIRVINAYANSLELVMKNREVLHSQIHDLRHPSAQYFALRHDLKRKAPLAVHLRLGDYANLSDIYGKISTEYLKAGIDKLSMQGSPIWLFTRFADEVAPEILEVLKPEFVVDETKLKSPIENMLIMSQCKGLICSNSTLSWWAALLSERPDRIVVPRLKAQANIFSKAMSHQQWNVICG